MVNLITNPAIRVDRGYVDVNYDYMATLNEALDNVNSALGVGLIFFDRYGNTIYVNTRAKMRLRLAEDFFEKKDGLIKNIFSKKDQVNLLATIDQLYTNNVKGEVFVNATVCNEVSVVMLKRLEHAAFNSSAPCIVMYILDSKRSIEVSSGKIARFYGLTNAETCLTVAIVDGMTAAEYSSANGVSIHTVYSHIKSILSKTGVRRQSELVRLVLERSLGFSGANIT